MFGLVVVQGQLGFLGHEFPLSGALHGLNAMALFGVALYAGRRLRGGPGRGRGRAGACRHASVMSDDSGRQRALKIVLPILATVAILALAWLWQASRVAAVYSVMDMGYPEYGGGAAPDAGGGHGGHVQGHAHHSEPSRLVTDLVVDPARPADVRVDRDPTTDTDRRWPVRVRIHG